jgi:hypothetical protein
LPVSVGRLILRDGEVRGELVELALSATGASF